MALQQSTRPQTTIEPDDAPVKVDSDVAVGRPTSRRFRWVAWAILAVGVAAISILVVQVLDTGRSADRATPVPHEIAEQNREPGPAESSLADDGSFDHAEATRFEWFAPESVYDQSYDIAERHRFKALAPTGHSDGSFDAAEYERMTRLTATATDDSSQVAELRRMINLES